MSRILLIKEKLDEYCDSGGALRADSDWQTVTRMRNLLEDFDRAAKTVPEGMRPI